MKNKKYLSLEEITQNYPFTKSNLRNLLFHREKNGLNKAIIKINRTLAFNKERFEIWLESYSEIKETKNV